MPGSMGLGALPCCRSLVVTFPCSKKHVVRTLSSLWVMPALSRSQGGDVGRWRFSHKQSLQSMAWLSAKPWEGRQK